MRKIEKLCHGHVCSGDVCDVNRKIVRLTDYITQLVVFQDSFVD
jgi:hypothetical protein